MLASSAGGAPAFGARRERAAVGVGTATSVVGAGAAIADVGSGRGGNAGVAGARHDPTIHAREARAKLCDKSERPADVSIDGPLCTGVLPTSHSLGHSGVWLLALGAAGTTAGAAFAARFRAAKNSAAGASAVATLPSRCASDWSKEYVSVAVSHIPLCARMLASSTDLRSKAARWSNGARRFISSIPAVIVSSE